MDNIILIGMPGSGKSSVGVVLAKALGYDFLDGDLLKLASFHKTVTQQNLSWEVACFDTQVPFLRQYLGDDAIIHPVPLELIHDHLNAERRSLI